MQNAHSTVATILYGAGTHRRFTQDGPVLRDVWAEYLNNPDKQVPLLIEPWIKRTPFEVTEQMRAEMGDAACNEAQVVYNRTTVSCQIALKQLVVHLIPLTNWYVRLGAIDEGKQKGDPKASSRRRKAQPSLPTVEQMWEDIARPAAPTYPHPGLLAFVRIVGLIAHTGASHGKYGHGTEGDLEAQLEELRHSSNGEAADQARRIISQWALDGWEKCLKLNLPQPSTHGLIYSVNRNRPAMLALMHSVRTVKGDAAQKLFSVRCDEITWAVLDCGIDATHPAFLDRSEQLKQDPADEFQRLTHSRVRQTYDFTQLVELLRGRLPSHRPARKTVKVDGQLNAIVQRIRRSQIIDWELLRPFLQVPHDRSYLNNRPNDSHGTHVAGILGANWPRDGDPLVGMCPDINLIDIRVCRPDGTSDEFIIMSALQFLRHLNANAEKRYIHGANLSLSIPHDVATYACGQTPICVEAERTVASGVVVVAAAGNLGHTRALGAHEGPLEQYSSVSITDPGNAESVLTVGSTHRIEPHTYGVSYFSSRGPTGDGRIKPDLLAPGEKILAPTLDETSAPLDGTSMAAPHVSGAAAMLMARHLELRGHPERVKSILCSTATDLGRERYFQGHGLIDILRAMQSV